MAEEIGENVRALLRDCITSYERLEILLLLYTQAAQPWHATSIEAQVHVPTDRTVAALETLRAFGLIQVIQSASAELYRYGPTDPTLTAAVDELVRAFTEQRATIMSIMSTNAIERVRMAAPGAFADAFILKRKRDDA